jgi:hypothetical protein
MDPGPTSVEYSVFLRARGGGIVRFITLYGAKAYVASALRACRLRKASAARERIFYQPVHALNTLCESIIDSRRAIRLNILWRYD